MQGLQKHIHFYSCKFLFFVSKLVFEMPDPLKKKLAQSNHGEPKKTTKMWSKTHIFRKRAVMSKSDHLLDIFSVLGDKIELIFFERVRCLELQVLTPNNGAVGVT